MTKDQTRKLVIDIISDIAPDEDLSAVKPDVRLRDQLQRLICTGGSPVSLTSVRIAPGVRC